VVVEGVAEGVVEEVDGVEGSDLVLEPFVPELLVDDALSEHFF